MATPKKEASGRWSLQIFVGYEYVGEKKKRIYKQFTADTKKQVQQLAAEYKYEKKMAENHLTLHDAVQRYIEIKEAVLSPSTIRAYNAMWRNHYCDGIGLKDVSRITSLELQVFVGDLSKSVNPKSVKNIVALGTAAISMFRPDFAPRLTFPAIPKPQTHIPSEEDLKLLLGEISGTPLEVAVLLGTFVPARRGEICALDASDVEGNILHIRKSMVKTKDGQYVIKETPKTAASNRDVILPDFVVAKLPKVGRLCPISPDGITKQLSRRLRKLGIKHFNFHATRHMGASIYKEQLKLSDKIIQQRGGWESDHVLKQTYFAVLDEDVKQAAEQINRRYGYLSS